MTVPTPCGLKDVAVELAISSANLSMGDGRVRTLAGIASGPIGLKDCNGKSASVIASIVGGDQGASDSSGAHLFTVAVTPSGGVGPYTYLWHMPTQGGPTGSAAFSGSTTGASVNVLITETSHGGTYSCQVYCTVTDSASHVANSNTINVSYSLP